MTNHPPFPDQTPGGDDARIDALAREAGAALRRPAPADGVAHVRRTTRRRQAIRAGAAGMTLAALTVVGVVALRDGDQRATVVPATADTSAPPGPSAGPTTSAAPPGTDAPTTLPTSDPVSGPDVVYGSDTALDTGDSVETHYDPVTGVVLGSGFAMDGDASLAAQQQWYDGAAWPVQYVGDAESDRPGTIEYTLELGRWSVRHAVLPSEIPTLDDQDPAALPFFDRCQQSELIALGGGPSDLPARARGVSATADGRYLTVLRADCPVSGTLDQGALEGGYDVVVEVYDLAALDQPGREVLREPVETCGCTLAGFSHDERYIAVRELRSDLRFRVFELATGIEAVVEPDCDQSFTAFADQYGPWVGDSTLALIVDCGDGAELLVRDVADGRQLRVAAPATYVTWAEVDVAHLDDPTRAWYVLCATDDLATPATCWVDQGGSWPVELPGASTASFLPLGFRAGG